MTWSATIMTKSGDYISVDNLISIDKKNIMDSSVEKIQDFKSFQLPTGNQLTFVGENEVVAISSNEIKYVQFSQG